MILTHTRDPVTTVELVRQAQGGAWDAYDVLVSERIDGLYRIASLILQDFDRAEDAVQEALVRCWRDLPRLRNPDRFDAWLRRVLYHAITDEARDRTRMRSTVARLHIDAAEADTTAAFADRDQIARVFGRLSIEHRTIVVLRYYLGLTLDEAASTVGIPLGTAKSRLHHATSALRAALEADARAAAAGKVLA